MTVALWVVVALSSRQFMHVTVWAEAAHAHESSVQVCRRKGNGRAARSISFASRARARC